MVPAFLKQKYILGPSLGKNTQRSPSSRVGCHNSAAGVGSEEYSPGRQTFVGPELCHLDCKNQNLDFTHPPKLNIATEKWWF